MRFKIKFFSTWILAAGIGSGWLFPSYSFPQTPYYQGKTIVIIRAGAPGGSGDMQARALIPYLKKYIPGKPAIIAENMPGAGGTKAANFIFSKAKPDGLRICAVGAGLVAGPILGIAGTQYDLDKLIYLGSTDSGEPYVFFSLKKAGFDSLDKLREASRIRIGAQDVGHPNYISGRMFAYLMGLKDPSFVVGYSGPEVDLALARGEVDVRSNTSYTVERRSRDALEKGQFNVHGTLTIPKGNFHPRFANVPDLDTFARNEKERQLVNLFRAFLYPRWPYILPPGTPPEIVKILRGAMVKAFNDPGFPLEFKKLMGDEPSPFTGEELQAAIRKLPRDPEIVELYKKMAAYGPLPPR